MENTNVKTPKKRSSVSRFFRVFFSRGFTEAELPDNLRENKIFTLKQLYYILRCEHHESKNKLNGYTTDTQIRTLREYLSGHIISEETAKHVRYTAARPEEVFTFIYYGADKKSFTVKIDEIADTYRNPAGHTGETSLFAAECCCREVIGPEAELQKVEGILLDLLQKTAPFTHPDPNA